MKNNQETKSELTYEFEEELEMERSSESDRLTLLIKHDYYSSDTEHGRMLIKSFLETAADTQNIDKIILIDSGVKLLKEDNPCFAILNEIISHNMPHVLCCKESLVSYGISCPGFAEGASSGVLFLEMMESQRLITIE